MIAIVLLLFILLFTLVFAFIMASSIVGFIQTRVPYVRTRHSDILEIVRTVPISKSDLFFDLGCGDGKVLFAVEKESGARVRGYELTLWTHLLSRMKKLLSRSKAQLVLGNFFKSDLSEATVIYCYLFPSLMPMIGDKVKAECIPGTKIISRDFPISNLVLSKSWRTPTNHTLYFYQL